VFSRSICTPRRFRASSIFRRSFIRDARDSEISSPLDVDPRDIVVLSPDEGSVKRALRYQKKLNATWPSVDKRRVSADQVEQANLIGASPRRKGRADLR